MSPRAEKFCLEYARTGNATESYKLAGYKFKNSNTAGACANRLLRRANIQKRLQELTSEVKNMKIADVQKCQELLTEIAMDRKQKGTARVQALTTLLKVQGAFSTQINLTAIAPVILKDDVNE